jgi:hypothetical protein
MYTLQHKQKRHTIIYFNPFFRGPYMDPLKGVIGKWDVVECYVRSDKGIWIEGFAKAFGDTTAYMAELWSIYEELRLAQRRGVMRLELQTDSQVIAQSLNDSTSGCIRGCALVKRIRSLQNEP